MISRPNYSRARLTTAIIKRMITTTEISGISTWKSVCTPALTDVNAVVAIAVKAPGSMNAATYSPTARKMISTTSSTPLVVTPEVWINLEFLKVIGRLLSDLIGVIELKYPKMKSNE